MSCFGGHPVSYKTKDKDDLRAIQLFEQHREEYHLDTGSNINDRYRAAAKMTKEVFGGTRYYVEVEEYCCMCTVSKLWRID